ncbi:MAG: hypothetical protein ACE5PT_13645, partial [Gemmatimonadales bacterium]
MKHRLTIAGVLMTTLSASLGAQAHPDTSGTARRFDASALILLSAFYVDDFVDNVDLPAVATQPPGPFVLPPEAGGATMRQSRITVNGVWPRALGGEVAGLLQVDFFGGQLADARESPLLRLRRTHVQVRWPNAWLLIGQEAPPIAAVSPSSPASVAVPGFSHAGNLWRWTPQVRAGASAGRAVLIGIEAAALAPRSGEPVGVTVTQPDRAERAERPQLEGRVLVRWGGDESSGPSEISVGGHIGWMSNDRDSLLISRAGAASAKISLGRHVELRGEAFFGQALAGLGAGIGQVLGPGGTTIYTSGGWAQLNLRPASNLELGGGYGLDDPDDIQVDPDSGMVKNVSWEAHLIWAPAPLVFGLEYR